MTLARSLALAGGLSVLFGPVPISSQTAPSRCSWVEDATTPLHLGGDRYAYVEPHFFDHLDGVSTLLGHPTYVWVIDATSSSLEEERSFFGVRRGGDRTEVVPNPPVPGEITWTRAVRLSPHHLVVFLDVRAEGDGGPTRAFVTDLVDGEWSPPEPLPTSGQDRSISVARASDPVVYDDESIRFAVPHGPHDRTVVFTRTGRGWATVEFGRDGAVAAAAMGPRGEKVAEVGQTRTEEGPRPFVRVTRLDAAGARQRVLDPSRVLEVRGAEWSRDGTHLAVAALTPNGPGILIVDSELRDAVRLLETGGRLLPSIELDEFGPAWVLDGGIAGAEGSIGLATISENAADLTHMVTRFHGPARVVAGLATPANHQRTPANLIVVGPEARFPPAQPFVRSLFTRMTVTCP